ncbi:MAG: hypothetical protein ABFS09_10045 [Thermodesulfobacteriota bacterium]
MDNFDVRKHKHATSNLQSKNQRDLKKNLHEAYGYIREVREHLKYWQQPTEETTRQYSLALKRLIKSGLWPEQYAQTKRGFYFYRAAVVNMSLH